MQKTVNMTGPEHYARATGLAVLTDTQEDVEVARVMIEHAMLHAKLAEVAVLAQPTLAANSPAVAKALAVEWNRVAGMHPIEADKIRKRG